MKTTFLKEKENIEAWLNKYEVKNYTMLPDEQYAFIVNVEGDVHLSNLKLTAIPVKFNHIEGNFFCHDNDLISLKFCPKIVGNIFNCSFNRLSSLEYCPETVGDDFLCEHNPALGHLQEIYDFNEIYAAHLKKKIEKEKSLLVNSIRTIDQKSHKESFKI